MVVHRRSVGMSSWSQMVKVLKAVCPSDLKSSAGFPFLPCALPHVICLFDGDVYLFFAWWEV